MSGNDVIDGTRGDRVEMNGEIGQESKFLLVAEAAKLLNRSKEGVRLLLRQGKIKGFNPTGRKWLVPRPEVNRFLEGSGGVSNHGRAQGEQPNSGKPEGLGTLMLKRIEEHSDYLRKHLRHLMAHICVPRPEGLQGVARRLEGKAVEVLRPVGHVLLSEDNHITARQEVYLRLKVTGEELAVAPEIERANDWRYLWPHLEKETDPAIVQDYIDWKKAAGGVFRLCCVLWHSITEEADNRILDGIRQQDPQYQGIKKASGWGEHGVGEDFYLEIYSPVLGGQPRSHAEFSQEPVSGQAGLIALWRGGRGLAIGTKSEVDVYEKVHESLVKEAGGWAQTRALLDKYEECARREQSLLSKLFILEKRGDFKGVCEICEPWHGRAR